MIGLARDLCYLASTFALVAVLPVWVLANNVAAAWCLVASIVFAVPGWVLDDIQLARRRRG